MSVYLARRWRQQPPHGLVEIDWSNPLARGLAFAWYAGAGPNAWTAQGGRGAQFNAVKPSGSPIGPAAQTSAGQQNLEWSSLDVLTTSDKAGGGDFTMMVYANPSGTGAGAVEHLFASKNDAAGAPFAQAFIGAHTDSTGGYTSGAMAFFTYSGSGSGITSLTGATGLWHQWTGRRVAGELQLYRDREQLAASSQPVQTITQAGRYIGIGSRGNGTTEAARCGIGYAYAFNRAIGDVEIAELGQAPWQFYRPRILRIYSLGAFPAAPTGVTAGSATPSGFTVSWTDASSDETGFKVQTAPSPYTTWTTASGSPTAANATSLAITGLAPGTYKARVASTNANGDSAWVESGTITTVALTYLKPISVGSAGPWTASSGTAVSAVDETSPDDADYITAASAGRISYRIESHTSPSSNNWHAIAFRARATGGRTVTAKWWQGDPDSGGTQIATATVTPGASFADYRLELSSGEAASITDRTNVWVTIERN